MTNMLDHPIILGYIEANNFGRELGMQFNIVNHGEVEYRMPITKKHLATPIAAHGGSISALMDATMGVCALSEVINENRVVSTLEMKLSFISPGLLGDTMIARAKIIKSGKRILFVEGVIENQVGKMIATATGTFNAYPASKAGFAI